MKKEKRFATKRLFAIVLTLVMTFSVLPMSVAAGDYEGHWAQSSIERAVQMGWFAQNDAGTYRPNSSITRAEFVTMVNKMMNYTEAAGLSEFSDVSANDWHYNQFAIAVGAGYISGANGKLNPNQPITRNEAVTIFARISGLNHAADNSAALKGVYDASSIPAWATPYASAAIAEGLIAGSNGNFNGASNITRAETAVLLERLYDDVRVFGFAGEFSVGEAASVMIAAPNVTLKNTKVTKDLIIAEAVGNGDVYLNNVDVLGKLDVRGGGMNSIHITDSDIAEIVITKDEVRVVLSNGTSVTYANVGGSGSTIELGSGANVDKITVAPDAEGADVTIGNGATVGTVDVQAEDATVSLTGDATVSELNVSAADATVSLEGTSSIETVNVAEAATGASIATGEGTSMGTVTLDAPTQVTGTGAIETANINVSGTVIEAQPKNVEKSSDVDASIGEGPQAPAPGGGGSTGGGSSIKKGDIEFDANGGTLLDGTAVTGENIVTQSYNTAAGTIKLKANEYKKSGNAFMGWSIDDNTSVEYGDEGALPTNFSGKLYAVWEAVGTALLPRGNYTVVSDTPDAAWEVQLISGLQNDGSVYTLKAFNSGSALAFGNTAIDGTNETIKTLLIDQGVAKGLQAGDTFTTDGTDGVSNIVLKNTSVTYRIPNLPDNTYTFSPASGQVKFNKNGEFLFTLSSGATVTTSDDLYQFRNINGSVAVSGPGPTLAFENALFDLAFTVGSFSGFTLTAGKMSGTTEHLGTLAAALSLGDGLTVSGSGTVKFTDGEYLVGTNASQSSFMLGSGGSLNVKANINPGIDYTVSGTVTVGTLEFAYSHNVYDSQEENKTANGLYIGSKDQLIVKGTLRGNEGSQILLADGDDSKGTSSTNGTIDFSSGTNNFYDEQEEPIGDTSIEADDDDGVNDGDVLLTWRNNGWYVTEIE